MKLKTFGFRFDFLQIIPLFTLLTIGIFFIYGTGQQIGDELYKGAYLNQLKWIGLGLIIWFTLSIIDYRKLTIFVWPLYLVSTIMLTLVLFVGDERYGARRWLSIFGTSLQPSEIGKLAALLATSWVLSRRNFSIKDFSFTSFQSFLVVGIVTGIQFLLILIEPDLGSSLVLIVVFVFLVFAAGLNKKFIFILLIALQMYATATEVRRYFGWHKEILITRAGVSRAPSSLEKTVKLYFPMLSGYQQERILVFLDQSRDIRNKGWNQLQARLAVGSGGLSGKGFMQGTQNQLGFLPHTVSNSDFIFPVIAEETGFIGSTILVFLYLMLVASAVRTSVLARDLFGRYVAIGTASIFFMHSVVNIGMSIGLMPVTGLPLPFVSSGGTFVVVSLTYMGILQSIYRQRRSIGARPEMEATKITNTRFN